MLWNSVGIDFFGVGDFSMRLGGAEAHQGREAFSVVSA